MTHAPVAGDAFFRMTDGRCLYEMQRPWQRGEPSPIGGISQLALDSHGRVLVLQRNAPHLLVFRPDGTLERSFDDARMTSGHGIFIDAADRLYVVTYDAHQVLVFAPDFTPLFALGAFNQPAWGAPFNHPTDVAVAADGEIYVSDGYGNACVHRFAPDGRHLGTWGAPGSGPGEFSTPHAVWVLPDERVLVTDRENDRIQVFDRQGRYLDAWHGFVRPMDLWSDGQAIFVTEQAPRVTRLDLSGRIVGRFRAFGVYPHGIWGDADGSLYVAEQGPVNCVTKYARVGSC